MSLKLCFYSLLLVLLTLKADSQPQATFKKFKADQSSLYNELVFAPNDSTFFLAGGQYTPGYGTHVTKFDMWGTPVWSKRYTYTTYERYPEIHATPWGDLLITTYPPNFDFRVRCVDGNGNYKWGSITSNNVRNYHVESFDDGTLYLVNHGSAGPYIFKTDSSGVLKWKKSYYNVILNAFDFNEVVRAGATALLIGGYASTYGTTVLMHIDSTGAVISSRALIPSVGTTGLREMELYKISSNKIWISGIVGTDAVIAESDSSGNIQWVRRISSPGCRIGTVSPSAFPSGEIAFSALYTDTLNTWRGSCAGILHPDGTIGHAFRFGSDDSMYRHDNVDAIALKNGKMVVAAFERLYPVNASIYYTLFGMIDSTYTGIGSCYTSPVQLFSDTMSFSYVPVGTDSATATYPNYFFSPFGVAPSVLSDSTLCVSITSVPESLDFLESIRIYPNPATEWIVVEGTDDNDRIVILDVTGRILISKKGESQRTECRYLKLKPGIYTITVSNSSRRLAKKVVITEP